MKPRTFHFGLVGYPLGHSLSPQLHTAALRSCQQRGAYRLYPAPPDKDGQQVIQRLLDRMRDGELDGLNITIPHKQTVLPMLDDLSPAARAIGAVNTIYKRGSKLVGDNTDALGFISDLKRQLAEVGGEIGREPTALNLGAGGSARAVVYALRRDGWAVYVAARRIEQAEDLVSDLEAAAAQPQRIAAVRLERSALLDLLDSTAIDLIVNTTPLGMYPDVSASAWPDGVAFPEKSPSSSEGSFVYDLVYNPGETMLVHTAKRAGLPAANGLGMLVDQAALSFQMWTGCAPSRERMLEAVASVTIADREAE